MPGEDIAALDLERVIADASGRAGYEDWDHALVREPLGVLVDGLRSEAQLTDEGRARVGERLRTLLTAYVELQHDTERFPEILAERIEPPIILVGLPRSGTTILHTLMAADPGHRAPQWWECLRPSPPPDEATYQTDPRRAIVQEELDAMLARTPRMYTALAYAADLTAECNTLCQPSLRAVVFPAHYHVPSYQAWYVGNDQGAMYAYHYRALQQLQWRGPKGRWVLKAPPHLFTMDALVARYPEATLISINRDPMTTVASNASLQHAHRVQHLDAADPKVTGRDVLEDWGMASRLFNDFRTRRPDVRIIDLTYSELQADPIGTTAALYELMGQTRSEEATEAVREVLSENAREKRPEHRYTLAEFGLTEGDVIEHFGTYEPLSSL
jgi:hypothetical protein